jgi:hypothetical protein
MLVRCLFLKLFNEVDTEKQLPLFDAIVKNLDYKSNENDLNILLLIIKDAIKLKYGKRISNLAMI